MANGARFKNQAYRLSRSSSPKDSVVENKTFKSVGVKSGYQAFQIDGMRGTVYIPKGFFPATGVPETVVITAEFAQPVPTAQSAAALQAEVDKLKAELAAALASVPTGDTAIPDATLVPEPEPVVEEPRRSRRSA